MPGFDLMKIDARFELLSIAVDRTYLTGKIVDDNGKELAVVKFNWGNPEKYSVPFVGFSEWGVKSGWTKLYNKDNYIHDMVADGLVKEGYIPKDWKKPSKKQQSTVTQQVPKQTTSQSAPKPQTAVSDIMKSKVKVASAPKPQEKPKKTEQPKQQPKVSFSIPKPSKSNSSFKRMTEEELAQEMEYIVDDPSMNHDVDEDLLT